MANSVPERAFSSKPCSECDYYPCDHTGCDCSDPFHNPGPGCPRQDTGPTNAVQIDEGMWESDD
jgi:hypothetical protein